MHFCFNLTEYEYGNFDRLFDIHLRHYGIRRLPFQSECLRWKTISRLVNGLLSDITGYNFKETE